MAEEQATEVIAEVRTDGAAVVAAETMSAVAAETGIVTTAVEGVAEELAEHAELSEERHEEILEGEAWLRNRIEALTTSQSAGNALMTALQGQLATFQTEMRQEFLSLRESRASLPSIPTQQSAPSESTLVEPLSAASTEKAEEQRQEEAEKVPKKRRVNVL